MQLFENHGVHLTQSPGKVFLDAILYNTMEYFDAYFTNLEIKVDKNEHSTSVGLKNATKEVKQVASKNECI